MDITVLYVKDCPHVAPARQRIADALDRVGLTATIAERLIVTQADAATTGFPGSPTIHIDGVDPLPADNTAGLSCRLYPGDAGVQGAPTVEQLVDVLTDAIVERLRWAAFDRLRTNRPATPEALAFDLDCTVEAVAELVAAQSALGLVEVDDTGGVVGAHGLTLVPTRHTLTTEEAELHTWCALDAIGIPAAAGANARVTTTCGWCERLLTVTVIDGAPGDGDGIVLWLPTEPCANLRQQFCSLANLFCTPEHLQRWRDQVDQPVGRVLTLAETAELGRQSWRRDSHRWGTATVALAAPADQPAHRPDKVGA